MPDMDETYHSRHGALAESRYVFIENGLQQLNPLPQACRILEIGFGTGLNALLALQWQKTAGVKVQFTTLEFHPLPSSIVEELNYPDLIDGADIEEFRILHSCPWGVEINVGTGFSFEKHQADATKWRGEPLSFDVIFFDAFAPNYQSEMWGLTMMKKMANLLAPCGIFTTYCAQGQVRRDLKEAGLTVHRLPGPPGKREMLQARKV
jgi:tRNA U34 5-methylaminomethyl-2-thiouridine-forming methyltransferase MnmC